MTTPTTPMFFFGDCEQYFEPSETPTAAQAVDSKSLQLEMSIVDDASVELELAPPEPFPALAYAERLEYLHTAVALCPANSPEEARNVFKWGANGILGGFHEASIVEGPTGPFEPGRFFQTAAIPAMRQLRIISDEYYDDFDDDCCDLDAAMADMRGVCRSLRLLRALTNEVDLDSMTPPESEPASPPEPAAASSAPPACAYREESSSRYFQDYPPVPNDDADDTNSIGSHEYCDSDVDVTASDGCDIFNDIISDYAHDDDVDDYSSSCCSNSSLFSELDPEAMHFEYEGNNTRDQDAAGADSEWNLTEGGGGGRRIVIDEQAGLGIDRPSLATGSEATEAEYSYDGGDAEDTGIVDEQCDWLSRARFEPSVTAAEEARLSSEAPLFPVAESRTLARRRAEVRATPSRVRAGKARIAAGIG